jgi:hypothetical protein
MKVVFYSEPPKSKVENLLKSLDDSEDVPPPAKRTAPWAVTGSSLQSLP